jgi:hypothetical protein
MKLVDLTHRKRGGGAGLGQKTKGNSDDVVVFGVRRGRRKKRERRERKRGKKIGDRVGDTTGNDEEWVNRKSKSSFFLFLHVKSSKITVPWSDVTCSLHCPSIYLH